MKTETKQNLWQIVKYLLTLGVSAIVNAIKRRKAKKTSLTTQQVDKLTSIDVVPRYDPNFKCVTTEDAEQIQRSIDRIVKRK